MNDVKQVTDAANGLVAALNTFMPVLEEAGVDVHRLLVGHTPYRVWRTFMEPYPDPIRQRGPDAKPRKARAPSPTQTPGDAT